MIATSPGTATQAQQSEKPVEHDRADNLGGALRGDRGAHGIFDREAHAHSLQFLAVTHRRLVASALAAAVAAMLLRARR